MWVYYFAKFQLCNPMWYLYLKSNYIIVFSNYNSEKTLLGERGLLEEHIAKCSSIWGKSCSKVYFILYLKYHLKEFGERRRDRILILSSNFWTLKQSKRLKKNWFKKKKGFRSSLKNCYQLMNCWSYADWS